MKKLAIIIVDMQNDFMDNGGTLPVAGAMAIIPEINKTIAYLANHEPLIVTTQDWHPPDHTQLQPNGGQWPVHCIQDTPGADLVAGLQIPECLHIVKGFEKDQDGYSGFEGRLPDDSASLTEILNAADVDTVYVVGVATDYCVKATAIDAAKNGFNTAIITNAVAGVAKETTDTAMHEMSQAGVHFLRFD